MAAVGLTSSVEHYLSIGERVLRDTEERVGHAELLRLRAWTHQVNGDLDSARTLLEEALAVAEQQGARYFGVLSALDLVGIADRADQKANALDSLKKAYQGFTEGLSFPALIRARETIEAFEWAAPGD